MLVFIALAPFLIESVTIERTHLPVNLAALVGQISNTAAIDTDVQVNARKMLLHKLVMEPSNLGLHLTLPDFMPLDRAVAQAVAEQAGRQLRAGGYPKPEVNYSLTTFAGRLADLHLDIQPGERVRVKQVRFEGAPRLDPKELRGALRALRIRRVLFWHLYPAYSVEAIDADLARLRSLYLSKGFFDACIRSDDRNVQVSFFIEPGPRYPVRGPSCACLLKTRREAERQGILDFAVTLDTNGPSMIHRGQPYRIGRIRFIGNHHYGDATLRRNILLDEGQLLDETLLRKSLDRLNRSMRFEPITEQDASIDADEPTGTAGVTIRLRERKRGAWNISGPVGPASFAGPLQASISSRGIFQLSTYTFSVSMIAFAHSMNPLLPVLSIARPFSPSEGWKSGFAIVPQLGWRASALSYAVAQIQQRALPALSGDRGLVPVLPVTVKGPSGNGLMLCEPPKPRFAALRTSASVALRFMGTIHWFLAYARIESPQPSRTSNF